jgi:ATP-dependent exoDNAse (exonuclease V) beta subunit
MSERREFPGGSAPPRGDAEARRLARDIGRSIQLQAPAGSGKTTVLAQRFLAALAACDEPEEVLAITFTRKAATEMRERVLAALEDRLPPQAEPELWQSLREAVHAQAARRGWRIEELAQRLRIQTIDSLAAELARAMPVLGRMQADLRIVDDATMLYVEAARRTLRLGDEDPDDHADIDRLLRRLDNNTDRAVQLLAQLLPGRNRWLELLVQHAPEELASQVQASLVRIVEEHLARLGRALPPELLAEAAAVAAAAARNRAEAGHPPGDRWCVWLKGEISLGSDPQHLPYWQALADMLLAANEDRLLKKVNARQGFPAKSELKARWMALRDALAERPHLVPMLVELRVLPPPVLEPAEQQTIAALARVLLLAAAELKLVFRQHGLVDHAEIAAVARQALRALDEEGGYSLRQTLRVSHLLVDECQDTSPDQIELVHALTAGWQRGDARSLFLVGDPMQSIYLFRGSEVGLFLQTRDRGVGAIRLETLRLTRNFRSQRTLVEWVNDAFARIFPQTEDLRSSAVTFLPAEHARAEDPRLPAAVTLWPQPADDATEEARMIAREIGSLRAVQPDLTIAVLVQTRALAAPILRALHAARIPTLGVDLAALSDRPVVRDLVALGRALLDGGDRTAWLAVLRSPPCGLTLEDLRRLAQAAGDAPLVEVLADGGVFACLSDDGAARLARVAPILVAAWRARGSLDVASAIEQCWQALGGEAACLDDTELAAARQYLLALRGLQEERGRPAPEELGELAARLKDRSQPAADNPVEILTIHHSKGLEWDVVFVPGMGKKPRLDDAPLLRWLELPNEEKGNDLLLAVRSIGAPNSTDPLAAYIRHLQARRVRNERLRLLYVAATRARLRLYLSGHALSRGAQQRPRPHTDSLLDLLWPAVAADYEAQVSGFSAATAEEPQTKPLPTLWHRLDADYRREPLATLPVPESLARTQAETGFNVEYSWVGPLSRAAGTVMHAELDRLARLGPALIADLPHRAAACEARLREQGIGAAAARETALRIVARLAELVHDPRARWLLFGPHREAASELPLSGVVDGALRNIVIDRMFVDADGTRWIIDYKTGVHAGAGLEEFLARELERYRPQLELYARMAAALGPELIRAALYFPWMGALVELPDVLSAASR